MFSLSKLYATLTGSAEVHDRTLQDFIQQSAPTEIQSGTGNLDESAPALKEGPEHHSLASDQVSVRKDAHEDNTEVFYDSASTLSEDDAEQSSISTLEQEEARQLSLASGQSSTGRLNTAPASKAEDAQQRSLTSNEASIQQHELSHDQSGTEKLSSSARTSKEKNTTPDSLPSNQSGTGNSDDSIAAVEDNHSEQQQQPSTSTNDSNEDKDNSIQTSMFVNINGAEFDLLRSRWTSPSSCRGKATSQSFATTIDKTKSHDPPAKFANLNKGSKRTDSMESVMAKSGDSMVKQILASAPKYPNYINKAESTASSVSATKFPTQTDIVESVVTKCIAGHAHRSIRSKKAESTASSSGTTTKVPLPSFHAPSEHSPPRTPFRRYTASEPDSDLGSYTTSNHSSNQSASPPETPPTLLFDLSSMHTSPPRNTVNAHFEVAPGTSYIGSFAKIFLQNPCLQCVVAGMPCDMGVPECSRCERKRAFQRGEQNLVKLGRRGDKERDSWWDFWIRGAGVQEWERERVRKEMEEENEAREDEEDEGKEVECPCLVQRTLTYTERLALNSPEIFYVVLVRLPCDSDAKWAVKKRTEESLLAVLQERFDRENWVLPVNDGKKAGLTKYMGNVLMEVERKWDVDERRGRQFEYTHVGGGERGWVYRVPI